MNGRRKGTGMTVRKGREAEGGGREEEERGGRRKGYGGK